MDIDHMRMACLQCEFEYGESNLISASNDNHKCHKQTAYLLFAWPEELDLPVEPNKTNKMTCKFPHFAGSVAYLACCVCFGGVRINGIDVSLEIHRNHRRKVCPTQFYFLFHLVALRFVQQV